MLKAFLQLPLIRQLHTRSLLFPTLALLAVAGVLLHGALYEPSPETFPLQARSETLSLPATRPTLGKTPLTYFSDYWLQVAQESRRSLLLTGQDKVAAIVVMPGVAVSTVAAAQDAVALEMLEQLQASLDPQSNPLADPDPNAASQTPSAADRLLGVDQETSLAIFETSSANRASPFEWAVPQDVKPGAYVAGVSLSPQGELLVTPGVAASRPLMDPSTHAYSFNLSVPFPKNEGATAIVDLDGALLAVALGWGPGVRVFPTAAIRAAIQRVRDRSLCQPFDAADIGSEVREILGVEHGLVIAKVSDAQFAEPAFNPGDILIEWAGKPVGTALEFQQLYQQQEPGAAVSYTLQRGARRITGKFTAPDGPCLPGTEPMVSFARLGLVVQWKLSANSSGPMLEAWNVLGVLDGSPAAAGGLMRGDWIVSAEVRSFRARDRQPFEKYERQPQPMVFEVWRGDRRRLLAVAPPAEPASDPAPAKP